MGKMMTVQLAITILVFVFSGCKKEVSEPFLKDFDPTIHGDYFVAVDGSDYNPGTYDEPWATWQRAFDVAGPGDTVYIRGGVYYPETYKNGGNICYIAPGGSPQVGNDGEFGNPVRFFNYPGEEPILDCKKMEPEGNFNTGILISWGDYLYFKGLTIRNVKQTKANVECFGIGASGASNLRFENITVHNVDGNAFRFQGDYGDDNWPEIQTDSTFFINCDAYNNCDSLEREPGATLGGAADGYKTYNKAGSFILFEGCRAWNNSDDGFDPGGDGLVVINNCWSFNNGYLDGDGTGIKTGGMLEDDGDVITRVVTNSISTENSASGIFILEYEGYYRTNARVYNNIMYNNEGSGGFFSSNANYPTTMCEWVNNISMENGLGAFSNAYQDYYETCNTWYFKANDYPGWVQVDSISIPETVFSRINPKYLAADRVNGELPDLGLDNSSYNTTGLDVGMSEGAPIGVDWDYLNNSSRQIPDEVFLSRLK